MSVLLEVKDLQKNFGGLAVTRDVSLTLQAGDRLALIGPNGAGKTTLVNLITGHLKPSGGTVMLAGADVTRLNATQRVRHGLVRSFQVTRLFADMTPEEHVAMALLQRQGQATRAFGSYRNRPEIVSEAQAILAPLGLTPVAQLPVADIPYGLQRLLEVALAIALRPKVLLLDEPAAGVPPADTHRIEQALMQLPPDLAVLMIEHDMDFVFRFASRVVVLAAGAVIFDGAPADVATNAQVRSAYLGSYADDRRSA